MRCGSSGASELSLWTLPGFAAFPHDMNQAANAKPKYSMRRQRTAFEVEVRLVAMDVSADAFPIAAPKMAAGFTPGANVELFRRPMRLVVLPEPEETVWECERL